MITEVVKKKRGPKPKIDEYYINPTTFKQLISDYYQTEVCIHELGDSLKKIAYGLGNKSNFRKYTYKDEMIGDALVKMYTALKNKKFKLDSDFNPFSYFNKIAFHAFINRIKKEKKHQDAICDYKEVVYHSEMYAATGGRSYIKPNSDDMSYAE
jgi:DNA-directed RNA polymerase specialized sigma24 family protein